MFTHLKNFRIKPSSLLPIGILVAPIFGIANEMLYLPITLILIPVGFLWLLFGKSRSPGMRNVYFYCPLFLFALWCYGIGLGFVNENPSEFVIRNFAGMSSYLLVFYFLYAKLDFPEFFRIMAVAATAALVAAIVNTNYSALGSLSAVNSIGEARSWRSNTILYLFPFLFSALLILTEKKSSIPSVFVTCLVSLVCVFYIVVPSMSKGNILCVFLLLTMCYVRLLTRWYSISVLVALIFPFIAVMTINLAGFEFGLLIDSFSSDNYSNQIREQQLSEILNDSNFVGNGLGAILSNGYMRLDEFTYGSYGLELTYLSLIHKFGIFSIVYFYVVTVTLLALFKKRKERESYFLLGAMIYLIPGAGNPILFSPPLVAIHAMILAMLAQNTAFFPWGRKVRTTLKVR